MDKAKLTRIGKAIAIWVPSVLLAALFVMQGLMKLTGLPAWIERFDAYGYPSGFHLVVGVLELVGGLGLLVPRFARYAALALAVVMLGASGTHLVHGETPNTIFTFILALVFGLLAYARSPGRRTWRVARPA